MTTETSAPGSVYVLRTQAALLDANGATPAAAGSMYTSDTALKVHWEREFHTGASIVQEKGDGTICLAEKAPTVTQWLNVTIDFCAPDPELQWLFLGGTLLTPSGGGPTYGLADPPLGSDGRPNGVSFQFWTKGKNGAADASPNPYLRWLMPKLRNLRLGPRTAETAAMATTIIGEAIENPNYGNGETNDWPNTSTAVIQYIQTATLPTAVLGLQAVPAQV